MKNLKKSKKYCQRSNKMILRTYIILIILFIFNFENSAQTDTSAVFAKLDSINALKIDTVEIEQTKKNNPTRAFIYSAVVPGLGQAYNKKYWKIPIVYSTLGGVAFLFNKNNIQYKRHLEGITELYKFQNNEIEATTIFPDDSDISALTVQKDAYRRNRDLSALIFLAVYALNFIDATVDAHLSDFDISDNLTFNIQPEFLPLYAQKNSSTVGLTFSLNF